MRGRGALVAAALLQLLGATVFAVTGASVLVMGAFGHHMGPAGQQRDRPAPYLAAGAVSVVVAVAVIIVSIALLRGRRWAWIASIALSSVAASTFAGFGIALRDAKLAVIVSLIAVVVALLVGGRRAVFSPTVVTPSRGA